MLYHRDTTTLSRLKGAVSSLFSRGLVSIWCNVEIIPRTRSPKASYSETGDFIDTLLLTSFPKSYEIYKHQPLGIKANASFFPRTFTLLLKLMFRYTWNKRKLSTELSFKDTTDTFLGAYVCFIDRFVEDFNLYSTQCSPMLSASLSMSVFMYFINDLIQAFIAFRIWGIVVKVIILVHIRNSFT